MTREKPIRGHRRAGVRHIVQVVCECGWQSAGHIGKGAFSQAHIEFRSHTDKFACVPA